MNKEEMYKAINKGIPNQIRLELPVGDLVKYCSADHDELLTSMRNIRNNFENAIVSKSGYNKSHHEFFDSLRLITNYKNSNTKIYASPICFLNRLKEILGVNNESLDLDNDELINEFKKRLIILHSINDTDELREKFPIIFEDYRYSLNLTDDIVKETNPIVADAMRANYQKYGLDTRFKVFLSNQKTMYFNLVNQSKNILEYANNHPIDLDNFEGLDKEKFELYVARKYLEYATKTSLDKEKQAAIYYLVTYLNESCGRVISMTYKNKELSNITLLKDFRKFLKNNRELKPVNESRDIYNSYHIKHVKNHINKYFNSLNNWCVIRITPNEILQNQQARLEKMAIYNMQYPETLNQNLKHFIKEKYMAMLIRKLNFYENSNYKLRLFGTGPFESHIAYFYSNGIVVIDKLYDESLDINPTYNEAIYVMDTNTFLNMITMDKPILRENDNVKRIFHSGDWEKRLQKEIEMPSINVNKDDTLKLVNKYRSKINTRHIQYS